MKRWFEILKQYDFKEIVVLFWALLLDSFYKRIPRQVFLVKNSYDYLLRAGGTFKRVDGSVYIELNGIHYILRTEGSDFDVFNQIIINRELCFVVDEVKRLGIKEPCIVDCGANIGLSTSFFKEHLPNAKIIAIEPDQENFEQLCKNIEINKFTNVNPMKMGVWHKSALLAPDYSFRDKSNWSFALRETEDLNSSSIEVEPLDNIMKLNGWTIIDVLKIDIEGSEFELFRNLGNWQNILDSVKIISVEIHEEIGSRHEIEEILTNQGFVLFRLGELNVGVRSQN